MLDYVLGAFSLSIGAREGKTGDKSRQGASEEGIQWGGHISRACSHPNGCFYALNGLSVSDVAYARAENPVGAGISGEVHQVSIAGRVVPYVVKSGNTAKGFYDALLKEAEYLMTLSHPNIVCCLGVSADDLSACMYLEKLPLDLANSLDNHSTGPLLSRLSIAGGIIDGVIFLHEAKGLIHNDLRCCNIMLDGCRVPKIIDLNAATPIGESLFGRVKPPHHPPHRGCASKSLDAFSTAGLCLSLVKGKVEGELWRLQKSSGFFFDGYEAVSHHSQQRPSTLVDKTFDTTERNVATQFLFQVVFPGLMLDSSKRLKVPEFRKITADLHRKLGAALNSPSHQSAKVWQGKRKREDCSHGVKAKRPYP